MRGTGLNTIPFLGRNLSTKIPDGATTSIAYDILGFDGQARFVTRVTDAQGKQKTSYRDIRELITAVVEEGNITTRYAYDRLKQITTVIDDQGNTTTVDYDDLGRRTVITNPDTGKTETVYDTASNVIQKITANLRKQGQQIAINYDYDHTRLTGIRYPNFKDNDVSYVYGDDSAASRDKNQVGRITKVSHQAGFELREYGQLGEITQETKTVTVASPGGGPVPTYVTQYNFDTFGRLLTLTLPDGEVITHNYDAGGNVNRIAGISQGGPYEYVKGMEYDRFEQRSLMSLGNGIKTRYTYNPDHRRLCKLESGSQLDSSGSCADLPRAHNGESLKNSLNGLSPASRPQFQAIHYAYDYVGNILGTTNGVAIPPRQTLGGPVTQTFHYDDLYRLTSADGVFTDGQSSQHVYTLGMSYDRIHNIINKDQEHIFIRNGSKSRVQRDTTYQWDYAYNASGNNSIQPHAPTQIGKRLFTHDDNGNQLGWENTQNGTRRAITWDEENRIQQIGDPSNTLSFAYDDQGQRVLKRGQHGQTVYVNQFFTVRNNALASKHVFAGTTRVVTKMEPGEPVGTSPGKSDNTNTQTSLGQTPTTLSTQGGSGNQNQGQGNGSNPGATNSTGGTDGFPGQGLDHRNDRANDVAQNTEKNPNLNGTFPGGGNNGQGGGNSGGNGNNGGGGNGGNGNGGGNSGGGNGGGGNNGGGQGNDPLLSGGEFLYYYHPDHLGSTSYVTDKDGELYEHIQYFPFGETWVQESSNTLQRIPYRYTSKELDEETGLYYYGARYYDPRTSVWQSADPILGKYLPDMPGIEKQLIRQKRASEKTNISIVDASKQLPILFNWSPEQDLPGQGGVYVSVNLNVYAYARQNPIRFFDPDGNINEDYDTYRKVGGSRSWRTNNPGNIEYGRFARSQGATGAGYAGRFAKFPTVEAGTNALRTLLSGGSYRDLTVADAMERYAPRAENDTGRYVEFLESMGIDPQGIVGDNVDALVSAIQRYEGWVEGTIEPLPTETAESSEPE